MSPRRRGHHNVYVVRLDEAVLESKRFVEANPEYLPGEPCVYVGMTGLSPEERFENHKAGIRACHYVRDHGLYLMHAEFDHLNPMPYREAAAMERSLARLLRAKGYAVWQK